MTTQNTARRSNRLLTWLIVLAGIAALCIGAWWAFTMYDPGLSRAEYARKADAVRADVLAQINEISRATGNGDAPSAKAKAVGQVQAEVDEGIQSLEDLSPPREWQDEHDQYVAAMKEFSDGLEDLEAATRSSDPAAQEAALTAMEAATEDLAAATKAMNASRAEKQ